MMSNKSFHSGADNLSTSHSIHVFLGTGGKQPLILDAHEINKFFKGNYAKSWAMKDGFISTFKEFKNGQIQFDMITDPRFKGNAFLLSKWIAEQYKTKVDLLKDATGFLAFHFKANKPIGFLVSIHTAPDEINKLFEECREAIQSLSKEPDFLHGGKLG